MRKNKITDKDFLVGEAEAGAFENGEYVKLHQSTLRKVDILANIIGRVADGTLATNASVREIHGGYFAAAAEFIQTHWLFAVIGLIGAIASIVTLWR